EFAIGFKVYDAVFFKYLFVQLQKFGIGHPMFGALIFDLRIRESDPDFIDLILSKDMFNELNLGTNKSDVMHSIFDSCFSSAPETSPFDVDTDKIFVRIFFGKANGIFAFTAAKFQNQRVIVLEEISVPFAPERK